MKKSKNSMNIRAAFLHNLTDAFASVGVIIAGTLILLYGWIWTDAAMTLIIAGYVLYQGFTEIPKAIHLLMDGTPQNTNINDVMSAIEEIEGVEDAHHIHIWQLDEQRNALEAHVVLKKVADMEDVKAYIKKMLRDDFAIEHITLEFEMKRCKFKSCIH